MSDDTPKRPPIPPFHPPRLPTPDEVAWLERAAERGKRAEEAAAKIEEERAKEPHVVNVDDDPHNANWLHPARNSDEPDK